jgi:hypothetical protein
MGECLSEEEIQEYGEKLKNEGKLKREGRAEHAFFCPDCRRKVMDVAGI